MAVFPIYPIPSYPMSITAVWKTEMSESDGGVEQRREKWLFSKYDVSVHYDILDLPEYDILWNFYNEQKGAARAFYIFDLVSHGHTNLYIGTADGSIGTFDIPGKDTSGLQVRINSTAQSQGFDYSVNVAAAEGGADQIVFASTPPQGSIITCDFVGVLRCRVRFEEDKLSRENFEAALYRTGSIKMKGLPMVER